MSRLQSSDGAPIAADRWRSAIAFLLLLALCLAPLACVRRKAGGARYYTPPAPPASSGYVATDTSMTTTVPGTGSASPAVSYAAVPVTLQANRSVTVALDSQIAPVAVTFAAAPPGWDIQCNVNGEDYVFHDARIDPAHWPAGKRRTVPTAAGDESCPVFVTVTVQSYTKDGAHVIVAVAAK